MTIAGLVLTKTANLKCLVLNLKLTMVSSTESNETFQPHLIDTTYDLADETVRHNERKLLCLLPRACFDKFEAHLQNIAMTELSDADLYIQYERPQASKLRPRLVHPWKSTSQESQPEDLDISA